MTGRSSGDLFPLLRILIITLIGVTMQINAAKAVELAPHLFKTILDSGQAVLVKEMPGTKVVTVQIWVRAGSVYEEPAEAGITHFIEHMIFKGTPSRGPGQLAGAIEAVGGAVNAYTSFEHTVYHATLSSRHWEMAMEVLTDAVLHSVFDPVELQREKKVVLEEVGMRNDRPEIRLFHDLMSNAYRVHPYRLPVIGNEASINAFDRQAVLKYIEKHYLPENFMVVVVGDVVAAEVLAKVKTLVGGQKAGGALRASLPQEPPQKGARLFTIEADIKQPRMALALPIASFSSPDSPVLDVIAEILGHGESSRLYRALRDEKQLVYSIDSSAFTPSDAGLFEVSAVIDGSRPAEALAATLVEVFRLKFQDVTSEELERAKRNLESDFVFSLERVEGVARVMGSFELMGGDPREDEYLVKVRAVTIQDIRRVAKKYFSGSRLTAGFLVEAGAAFALDQEDLEEIVDRAEQEAGGSKAGPAGRAAEMINGTMTESLLGESFLPNVHRFTLANKMTLLVREDPVVPTVGIRVVFPGGLLGETKATNGVFAFISGLLPKGTVNKTSQDVALAIANMAGSLSAFHGKNTFGLQASFLSRFFEEGLALVSEVLREPAFRADEADKIRAELLAQLKQQEDSLAAFGFREFNRLLFEGHPYGLNTAGTEEVILGFSAAELQQFYRRSADPAHMVLAVAGDVNADEVLAQVEELFGDWSSPLPVRESAIVEEVLPPAPIGTPKTVDIVKDKEQVHLIIGFLGTTLYDPDRYGLEVLDRVLSGQSGRLFAELRDVQSLAYSLSSFSVFGLDTGSFGIYLGTSPEKREQALAEVWKQLARVREEPVSDQELARAKKIIIAQYELGLQTHGAQALEMALNEQYGLGQNFGNRYIEALEQVDAGTVLATARKYILPEHYVMVQIGAAPAGAAQKQPGSDR